jgi:hypothetical protein
MKRKRKRRMRQNDNNRDVPQQDKGERRNQPESPYWHEVISARRGGGREGDVVRFTLSYCLVDTHAHVSENFETTAKEPTTPR